MRKEAKKPVDRITSKYKKMSINIGMERSDDGENP